MAQYRKLGRRTDHRNAMLRNLVTSLIKEGEIKTPVTRAKETKRMVDKMITLAKRGDMHAIRQAQSYIYDKEVTKKLFTEIAPKYADRQGGYTRIYKLEPRIGDGAEIALLRLI